MRYSEKEAFNHCPFKWSLQQEGLVKREDGGDANDKQFGAGIHRGLEFHYQGKPWSDVEKGFLSEFPALLKANEKVKTPENGLACLKGYIEYYREQDKNWEVIATEEVGTVEIAGENHDLHIDLIARNKQSGDIYFWDHKTSARMPSWKTYEISDQITRYTDYVVSKYGHCAGCVINHIQVDFIDPKGDQKKSNTYLESMKNPMSFYQFANKSYSTYHKKDMTIVSGFCAKFERQIFNRSKAQIEFWRESDEQWLQLMSFCKTHSLFPKALGKLCGWCEFYELCLASNDPQIRELLYEIKPKEQK